MLLWVRPHPHQKRSLRLKNNWRPINSRPAPPPCRIRLARRRQKPRRQKCRWNPAQNRWHRPARLLIQTGPRRSHLCLGTMTMKTPVTMGLSSLTRGNPTRRSHRTKTRRKPLQAKTIGPKLTAGQHRRPNVPTSRRRLCPPALGPSHYRNRAHPSNSLRPRVRPSPRKNRPIPPRQHPRMRPSAHRFPVAPEPSALRILPCRNIANRLLYRHPNRQRRSLHPQRTAHHQSRSNPSTLSCPNPASRLQRQIAGLRRNPSRPRPSRKPWPMPSL